MADKVEKIKKWHWYVYITGNPLLPESYYWVDATPLCSSGKSICAIYTRGKYEQPELFTQELKMHIANALVSGQPQPTGAESPVVLLKNK